jgi:putative ABC transport system permease protein
MTSPARAVVAGSLAHNTMRTLLCIAAIALGVGLGYAVQLINQAAINELALGMQTLSGEADLEVRGPREGFDESVYPLLARTGGVRIASPVVELDAQLAGRRDSLRIIGLDAFRAGYVQPGLIGVSDDSLALVRGNDLFVSPAAASWLRVRTNDTVRFQAGLREIPMQIAGTVGGGGQRFAVMDIAGAQAAFDRLGRLTRVDLRLEPGANLDEVAKRLRALLPAGTTVATPESRLAGTESLSRSYRVNLNVLALVALFTGGLLVFSTQALAVVRRRAQFALLRVLGLTRRQLLSFVLLDGLAIGAVGSAAGLAVGYGIAFLAVRLVGADLGSGYFRGVLPNLIIDPATLVLFFLLGIGAALVGTAIPALEAVRADPAPALKAGDEERAFHGLGRIWPGLVLLGCGAVAALLPAVQGLPMFGYVAIALLLLGTITLMPRFAAVLLSRAPTPRAFAPRLALEQLRGAPGQAMVSLATIVASVSLMVSMAIMVSSFRDSFDAWLAHVLPAEVYVRSGGNGDTAYFDEDAQRKLVALPMVRRAEFGREVQLLLDAERPRVALLARTIDPAHPARTLALVGDSLTPPAGSPPPVWVSEAMVDLYGYSPGRVIELPIAGRRIAFTVAGAWRDYVRQQGAIAIERRLYVDLTGDSAATQAALWLAPGATLSALHGAIAAAIPGGDKLELATTEDIRRTSLAIFDRTFAVTYALELASLLIGLFGLSSSFAALVLARRREFGMLRHIGMTRRQIGTMLASEGFFVTSVGLLVGVALGALISLILVYVVNRQSFHWSMDLSVPWLPLALFCLAVLALSTLTALASGRQAMSADVVKAVKDDW